MSISTKFERETKTLVIAISDRFDFSLYKNFRDSYQKTDVEGTTFELDLSATAYMDSSALGMILLLKEHADACNGNVVILNATNSVAKSLEIAQFHRLVKIESR